MLQIIKPILELAHSSKRFLKLKSKPNTRSCEQAVYSFRGKEFVCNEATISRLNYALSLNGSSVRYLRVREVEE